MEMIRTRIKSISLGEIERTKLKKVYGRMMNTRQGEIRAATSQGKKLLDARIWITRVENFYAKKRDIIALLTIHYIVDLEAYCRELFNDTAKRAQCLRNLLIKRKKRHDETKREYDRYSMKRKEKTELKLKKSKERLLGEIEWILIHHKHFQPKMQVGEEDGGGGGNNQISFKPFPVETAEPGKIYLPKDLDKDASKEHQRFCENCKMRKDAHIQTKECLLCPEMPFSLGAAAAHLSKTHGSLFNGGRKITHRKKRRKRNARRSRKRI